MKVFKLIGLSDNLEDTGSVWYFKVKKNIFEDERFSHLTSRLLSYTIPLDKRDSVTANPRFQMAHKGFRIEVLEVEDVSEIEFEDSDNVDIEGKEERKPKYEVSDTHYTFHTSKRSFSVDKDKLRDIMRIYCTEKKTINQTALDVGLLREELIVILGGLGVTKDSVPFIEEDFNELTEEQMAEITRVEKKRGYFKKLEENKVKDMERELKNRTRKDYLYDKIIESVKPLDSSFIPSKKLKKTSSNDIYHKFAICDVHAGLEIDSYFNTYNLLVMKERFENLTNNILGEVESGNIDIVLGGDDIHGKIKGSIEKNSDFTIKSTMSVIDCYISLLKTLSDTGLYNIRICKVNGSHESLDNNKTDRTMEENLGNLIFHTLERKFEDYENIKFIQKLNNTPFVLMEYFDYTELIGHGDEMNTKGYISFAQQLNRNVRYVSLAHFHHYKAEMLSGIGVTYNEAFCGSDQYAQGLGLLSESGVRYTQYGKVGKIKEKLLRVGVEL